MKNIEQAILRSHIYRLILNRQTQGIAFFERNKRRIEPSVRFSGLFKIARGGSQHFIHHINANYTLRLATEIRELKKLHTSTYTHVENLGVVHQISRVDSAAATIIHLLHYFGNLQPRKSPNWCCSTAKPHIGCFCCLFINVFSGF